MTSTTVTLNNGPELPLVGFGTWQLRGQAGDRQVEGATVGLSFYQGLFGHGSAVITRT